MTVVGHYYAFGKLHKTFHSPLRKQVTRFMFLDSCLILYCTAIYTKTFFVLSYLFYISLKYLGSLFVCKCRNYALEYCYFLILICNFLQLIWLIYNSVLLHHHHGRLDQISSLLCGTKAKNYIYVIWSECFKENVTNPKSNYTKNFSHLTMAAY